ncbi:MAG: hypothetical protein ABEJ87_02095 [Candidatus Nanohalobium sp.]
MTDRPGLVKRMIKEEWRMHSTLYKGRNFAAFPVMIFLFTFLFAYATTNYSTLGSGSVGTAVMIVAAFLGLGIGNLNYSGRDAWKNVLGDTSYLVYSSRTLPISRRKIIAQLVVKELAYYAGLFLVPVGAAALIGTGFQVVFGVAMMLPAFLGGIAAGLVLAQFSLDGPSLHLFNFDRIRELETVADKSLMDVLRSSGGIFKILFSLGLLTAFYWYVVLYFPMTRVLLNNPLISYSVMIGLLNLTVYNWLNRFDELDDYLYLPLGKKKILTGKEEAFMAITMPLTVVFISISYLFYPQHYFISLATGISATVYNLAVAIYTTGLEPNERLFNTWTFIKYMILENLVAGPLLALSIIYSVTVFYVYIGVLMLAISVALIYLYYKDEVERYVITDFMREQ